MSSMIVLITGANRGIGCGLLERYLLRPNHTIIAANCDPNHPTSKALYGLPKADGTALLLIQIDAIILDHPHILIANAGVAYIWPKVRDVSTEDMQKHTVPNTYGVVWLFQAMLPLLKKAKEPKETTAYGPTKVVLHWLTKAISIEEPWLTSFPIDPGWVQTDLDNRGAEAFGVKEASMTIENSVAGLLKVIDAVSKETHSGRLRSYTGEQVSW